MFVELAKAPLARLRRLDTTPWPGASAAGLRALGSRLGQLESLTVALAPGVAETLGEHVHGGRLRELTVSGSAGLERLLGSEVFSGVESLVLYEALSDASAAALVECARRGRLKHVRIPEREGFSLPGVELEQDCDTDEGGEKETAPTGHPVGAVPPPWAYLRWSDRDRSAHSPSGPRSTPPTRKPGFV